MSTKQRIRPQNVQVKWGLGWVPKYGVPIKLFHVVINGKTKASFHTSDSAWEWIYSQYEILTHDEI